MTISPIEPDVPTGLPPSKLYLDDIDRILHVLIGASRPKNETPGNEKQLETRFHVDGQVCDDLADLLKLTKSPREFSLTVTHGGYRSARFSVNEHSTRWWTVGLSREEEWQVHRKLVAICSIRLLSWRDRFDRYPNLVSAIFGLSLGVLAALSAAPRLIGSLSPWLVGVVALALVIPVLLIRLVERRHSIVILRYSWDQASARESFKERVTMVVVSAILGALLGVGATLLTQYLQR